MSDTVLVAIIAGAAAVGGGLITQLGALLLNRLKRRDDRQDAREGDLDALKAGLKWVLYDRIRHLGQKYIAAGGVDFDDRRILNEMHTSYHEGLGGNGDLDVLMGEVNRLPLRGQMRRDIDEDQ